jgi:hypothetical protein
MQTTTRIVGGSAVSKARPASTSRKEISSFIGWLCSDLTPVDKFRKGKVGRALVTPDG